jgi:hypothetical protein
MRPRRRQELNVTIPIRLTAQAPAGTAPGDYPFRIVALRQTTGVTTGEAGGLRVAGAPGAPDASSAGRFSRWLRRRRRR